MAKLFLKSYFTEVPIGFEDPLSKVNFVKIKEHFI